MAKAGVAKMDTVTLDSLTVDSLTVEEDILLMIKQLRRQMVEIKQRNKK